MLPVAVPGRRRLHGADLPARRRTTCASSATRSRSIIAESRYVAEDAAELVEIDYEPLPPDRRLRGRARPATRLVHPNRPEQRRDADGRSRWRPKAGGGSTASAAHASPRRFVQHRYSAVPMECRGVVARWDPFDQHLDVWMSSQNPHEARLAFSPRHGRAREQRPRADRRRRRRLRPEVVRRPRGADGRPRRARAQRGRQVERGPAREPHRVGPRASSSVDVTMAVDDDGTIVGARRRAPRRLGRLPDRWRQRRPARRHALHRPLPGAAPRLVEHRRCGPTPAARPRTAVRG